MLSTHNAYMSPPRLRGDIRNEVDLGKCDFANQLGPSLSQMKRGDGKLNIKNFSNTLIGNNSSIEKAYEKSAAKVRRDVSPI